MAFNSYNPKTTKEAKYPLKYVTYMLHVEDILVPHSEEDQHGQDGAADEGDGLGDDRGHGGHEDVHVVSRWSVSSRQSRQQLVFKLVKMSENGNCDYQRSNMRYPGPDLR